MWSKLKPIYLAEPTRETYLKIADMYNEHCQFPNVIGAIDGKHVRVEAPNHSGSNYFNYKHHFSIVLQGVAAPDLKFISVEVGAYGKESDGGIFSRSKTNLHIASNSVDLPSTSGLPNSSRNLPYFLIGDSAYPLKPYLMTRINSGLSHDQRIYNYRHSRARRCVECAFGVLAAKWRVLKSAICTKVETVENIVMACAVLHNAIIHHEGAKNVDDIEMWNSTSNNPVETADQHDSRRPGRPGHYAAWVREELVRYFNNEGAISWQELYI